VVYRTSLETKQPNGSGVRISHSPPEFEDMGLQDYLKKSMETELKAGARFLLDTIHERVYYHSNHNFKRYEMEKFLALIDDGTVVQTGKILDGTLIYMSADFANEQRIEKEHIAKLKEAAEYKRDVLQRWLTR
jgi:hypothetical protein